MKTITVAEFKSLGGKSVTFAPGGQHGTVPYEGGVALVRRINEDEFEIIEIASSQAVADLKLHDLSGDAYARHMADAPAQATSKVREMVEAAGFQVWHTGGGCLAWGKVIDGSEYLLTDDDGGITAEHDAELWSIGRYEEDGAWVAVGPATLERAIALADHIQKPDVYGGPEIVFTPAEFEAVDQKVRRGRTM